MDVIQVKDVTKVYKPLDFWKNEKITAVENVSFSVKKGEVFGLLGLNGAGKTTLMKVMLGLLKPTKGSVNILGGSIDKSPVRKRIGYFSELPYFPKYLTAGEILEYFAGILGIPAKEQKQRINEVLKLSGLSDKGGSRIKGFSKGMQGRLGLAQALLGKPDVLFMDEPMTGLDPMGYRDTRDIIINLNKKGVTVFFNSHILSEVEKICHRVGVMQKGKLVDISATAPIKRKYGSLENYFVKLVTGKYKKPKNKKSPKKKRSQKKK